MMTLVRVPVETDRDLQLDASWLCDQVVCAGHHLQVKQLTAGNLCLPQACSALQACM